MPLKLNSTGGGSVTLDVGSTASNYTVTLPATSGTLMPIASVTNNGVVYVNSSGSVTSGSGLQFDSSGNLGLGVTPSAWGTTNSLRAIEMAGGSLWGYSTTAMSINQNAYLDGTNYIYKTNAAATRYTQLTGTHLWYTAPSGTAGNAISFTQAMTLDASGNWYLGSGSSTTARLVANTPSGDGTYSISGDGTNYAVFRSQGSSYYQLGSLSSVPMTFITNSAERMRIDSSGNLLVGRTSVYNSEKFGVTFSSNNGACAVFSDSTIQNNATFLSFRAGSTAIGSIAANGTTAIAYNTSSDYRLKENIQPMQNALAVVQQLNPVTYTWKADGSDGQGFIAHELQAVVPDCVTGEKDAVDDDGKPVYQGIDTSFLVATLTAAIKELKQEIDILKGAK